MHFLITGHTGFKGAWLTLLLKERGHLVSGLSLEPGADALHNKAHIGKSLKSDLRCDIRNLEILREHFSEVNPDVIIHLAAQSLVRESYKDPIATFSTNVLGTVNVLKASQSVKKLKAQLIVTTDKVYRNVNKSTGYIESEPLGGHDPYSASKAMADIATQSWLASFESAPTAIARAGNVIGGGDICADRLIPDLVKAYAASLTPRLRSPNSIRPWQHVLDCLNGYLHLIDKIISGDADGAWNFGPKANQNKTVAEVSNIAGGIWGVEKFWEPENPDDLHEANLLVLNSDKARTKLGWSEKLSFEESVEWTVNWYKNVHNGKNALDEMLKNIRNFESR